MVRAGKDGIILGDWMAEYSNRAKRLREMRLDTYVAYGMAATILCVSLS